MIRARLKAFAFFWYDFIIGDDWRVALGVVLTLALTYWLQSLYVFAHVVAPACRRRRPPAGQHPPGHPQQPLRSA